MVTTIIALASGWGHNYAEDGGLASYGSDHREIARRSAYLVDRIFKGTRPADLPVEEPVTFELAERVIKL